MPVPNVSLSAAKLLVVCALGLLFSYPNLAKAQTLTPFETQALLAMLGGTSLTKLTLTGSVTWIAGSLKENGTVTLAASPDGSVNETWTLPTQSHSLAETGFAAGKSCSLTDRSGITHQSVMPNCVQPVTWFAPWVALNFLSSGGTVLATDATQPSDTAAGLVRLHFVTQLHGSSDATTQATLADIASRTAVDVLFDKISALPASLSLNYVLDSDPEHVIAIAVVFSDYRTEQGFLIPHRIQRYIQRTLQADLTINSVTTN